MAGIHYTITDIEEEDYKHSFEAYSFPANQENTICMHEKVSSKNNTHLFIYPYTISFYEDYLFSKIPQAFSGSKPSGKPKAIDCHT
jgi:hypothetical protein